MFLYFSNNDDDVVLNNFLSTETINKSNNNSQFLSITNIIIYNLEIFCQKFTFFLSFLLLFLSYKSY